MFGWWDDAQDSYPRHRLTNSVGCSSPGHCPVARSNPAAPVRSTRALTKPEIAPCRRAAASTSLQLRCRWVAAGVSSSPLTSFHTRLTWGHRLEVEAVLREVIQGSGGGVEGGEVGSEPMVASAVEA